MEVKEKGDDPDMIDPFDEMLEEMKRREGEKSEKGRPSKGASRRHTRRYTGRYTERASRRHTGRYTGNNKHL